MKTLKFFLSFLLLSFATIGFAQTKTETLKVSGECGTCKKKIEKAATTAGASYAEWNTDSKLLTIRYADKTNKLKIEHAIAGAGYDTPDVKATDEAYNKLDGCCQYERAAASANSCCDSDKCVKTQCMKDGKCTSDASCCKEAGCDKKACCKKE